MKKQILSFGCSLILLAGLLSSCGEDRSGEYYELIAAKTWLYQTMQENYLFYEELPAEDDLNFFNKPEAFVRSASASRDQKNGVYFSHVDSVFTQVSRAVSQHPTYGIESVLMRNSSNGRYYARILYVQNDSPASEMGLQRGDWILDVDSTNLTTSNFDRFVASPEGAYVYHIARKRDEQTNDTLYIDMPAPRYVLEPSVYKTRNFTTDNGQKVFYLMYNSFERGDEETSLKEAFATGMSQSPDYVVLDLRYNPGGYVSTGLLLSTMLAPYAAMGQPCLQLIYNDKLNKTEVATFDVSLLDGAAPFNYSRLYVITTENTASASEMVINCLRPYMSGRLLQVGEYTFGKNVAQSLFQNETFPQLEFWLTTSYLSNAEGFYDYYVNGLEPDYERTENLSGDLGELGTEQDSLMIPVLHHIENGSFPAQDPTETPAVFNYFSRSSSGFSPVRNTISRRPKLSKYDLPE